MLELFDMIGSVSILSDPLAKASSIIPAFPLLPRAEIVENNNSPSRVRYLSLARGSGGIRLRSRKQWKRICCGYARRYAKRSVAIFSFMDGLFGL